MTGVVKTVRRTLFSSYLVLILLSVIIFTVFFYFYTSKVLKEMAINSLQGLSTSVTNSLDSEINRMYVVSIDMTFSNLLKSLITEHLSFPKAPRDEIVRINKYHNTHKIIELMQTIVGPFKPVPQVNFYNNRGEMIGAGIYSRAGNISWEDVPWLSPPSTFSGAKQLTLPHRDPLLEETFHLHKNKQYISLYRIFFDEFKKPSGIIEIKQFMDMIFKDVNELESRVSVFTPDGTQIYPALRQTKEFEKSIFATEGIHHFVDPETKVKEIASVRYCREADWKVVVSQDERTLLAPVTRFTQIMLLFTLLLTIIAVFVASRFSRRLTVPLREIHDAFHTLDWYALSSSEPSRISSDLNELEELQQAFERMYRKLKDSMEEVVEARTHELKATVLALQSQMDPHFIYNMLTTIGIMAEENMTEKIGETIEHMTHLLRYISSSKSSLSSLREEVEYAERYLACMKIRFQDSLYYSIEIDRRVQSVRVPKLIIQPLIENAVKYGTNREPPWNVQVRVSGDDGRWEVTVADDGPGFTPEGLAKANDNRPEQGLEISGMGLQNISRRLAIYYEKEALYRIGNGPDGGAVVSIGGPIEPAKKL